MVIYGTKRVHVKIIPSQTGICSNCGEQFKISFSFFRKHVHIFWIPIFPLKMTGLSECSNCKNILNVKEMDDALKAEFIEKKKDTKGPIWQFSGLVLIIGLSIWLYNNQINHDKVEIERINAPQVNDVYEVKLGRKSYSTLKVVEIRNDSLFVCPNEYETDKWTGLLKINKAENYADFSYGISMDDLKAKYEEEEIKGVIRK